MKSRHLFLPALLLLSCAGCAQWLTTGSDAPAGLPAARLAADTVVLEIAFVRIAPGDEQLERELWKQVDEQHLLPAERRRLAENGFRIGLVGAQLPTELRRLLDAGEQRASSDLTEGEPLAEEITFSVQRRHARGGKRFEIVSSPTRARLSVLTTEDGRVVGRDYLHGQCKFAVYPHPQPSGALTLLITPEIQHGQATAKYVGDETGYRYGVGRESRAFKELQIQTTLAAGQTLMTGSTENAAGLGQHFFTGATEAGLERRLLLIRVAQTQADDLFAAEENPEPLVTPAD